MPASQLDRQTQLYRDLIERLVAELRFPSEVIEVASCCVFLFYEASVSCLCQANMDTHTHTHRSQFQSAIRSGSDQAPIDTRSIPDAVAIWEFLLQGLKHDEDIW